MGGATMLGGGYGGQENFTTVNFSLIEQLTATN